MKKILLSTTALVCAGLISAPAMADSANDSFSTAAKPAGINLGLGGFYKAAFGYVDSDDMNSREYGVKHDVEVYFTGETTLDNGLTIGTRIELDTDRSGTDTSNDANTDERFAYIRGSFGEIRAGQEDDVRRLLSVQAPEASSVFSIGDGYISFKDLQGTEFTAAAANGIFDGDNDTVTDTGFEQDAAKLIYFTPSFNGLTVGLSLTPDADDTGNDQQGAVSDERDPGDVVSIAALYDGQFNNVGVKFSAGYTATDGGTAGGPGTNTDDRDTFAVGLNFDMNGWTFGGSYADFSDVGTAGTDLDADMFDLGVTYASGAYVVGAGGSFGEYEISSTQEAELDTYQVSGSYTLGQGIALTGAIQYNELAVDGQANDVESTALMLGTDITF